MQKSQATLSMSTELVSLLHTVFDVDHCGIIVVNTKSIISFVNKAYAEFFGKKPEDMIGQQVDKAYVNSAPSRLPIVMATGQPEIGDIFYLNGRNVVANRFPIYQNGQIVGAVGKVIFRDLEEFNSVYTKANRHAALQKNTQVNASIKYDLNNLVGSSPQMIDLKESLCKIAIRNSTVLIRGESGTGKELFAHALHASSYRRNNPFIKVNSAAIPEQLLESELFGYLEGAFTGAKKGGQKGKFELADKGTLFLDEIGDMSLNMQVKLLRALQEREIVPLGSSQPRPVDVRIIAATNANLEEMIKYGKFRQDLYYRLNVVSTHIPSLRERKEDIPEIAGSLIKKFNRHFGMAVERMEPEVLNVFQRYNWPGNIRELENVIEQAFNFIEGTTILLEHIPRYLLTYIQQEAHDYMFIPNPEPSIAKNPKHTPTGLFDAQVLSEMVDHAQREMIIKALEQSRGNKSKAASLLGISRPSLYKKIDKYKLNHK